MNEAIQVCDLHYSYQDAEEDREHVVFDGLDLAIEAGSFVAVLGHNGCGKSTLAKHFNAILLPAGGRVTVYGMDTKRRSAAACHSPGGGHGVPEPGQPDRVECR